MSENSDKTGAVADLLIQLGWRDYGDAQWTNLDAALPQITALLHPAPAIPEGWDGQALYKAHIRSHFDRWDFPAWADLHPDIHAHWNRLAALYPAAPTPPVAADAGSEAAEVCAQAYQVVGSLLSDVGQFDSPRGQKILDNLGHARMIHSGVLPWPSFENTGNTLGRACFRDALEAIAAETSDVSAAAAADRFQQIARDALRMQPAAAPQAAEPVEYQHRLRDVPEYPWQPCNPKALADHLATLPQYEVRALWSTPPPPASTDEVARNDARYRWLRDEAWKVDCMSPAVIRATADFSVESEHTDGFVFHEELDAAIDAAMQQEGRSDG